MYCLESFITISFFLLCKVLEIISKVKDSIVHDICRDSPCVVGPPSVTRPVCLACLAPLTPASYAPCPQCSAPLCVHCLAAPGEHEAECRVITEAGVRIEVGDLSRTHILYAALTPLRMWLTRDQRPGLWARLNTLQCDTSEAHRGKPIWREVADYVQNTLGLKDLSLEEIVRLSGIKV